MKRSDDSRISQIKIPDAAVAIAAAAAQNSTNSGMYLFEALTGESIWMVFKLKLS